MAVSDRALRVRPWAGLVLLPAAWFGFEAGLAWVVKVRCDVAGGWVAWAWGGASLLVCAAAIALVWPMMARPAGPDTPSRPWLARVAVLMAGMFALAIAFQTLATLMVPPCVR